MQVLNFVCSKKLKIQADYFYEERNGIFLARAGLPAIVGLTTTPYVNVGKAEGIWSRWNTGISATGR